MDVFVVGLCLLDNLRDRLNTATVLLGLDGALITLRLLDGLDLIEQEPRQLCSLLDNLAQFIRVLACITNCTLNVRNLAGFSVPRD